MTESSLNKEINYLQNRSRRGYLAATLSVALILLILALFFSFFLFGKRFIREHQDAILLKISVHDGISSGSLLLLEKKIKSAPYCKSLTFISKETALRHFIEQTGDKDVIKMMDGVNPLYASYEVILKPDYIHSDSILNIQQNLVKDIAVAAVDYPIEMVSGFQTNMKNLIVISLIIGIIAVFLTIYLVMNTIKLRIYAQRLSIRTMQLIGATAPFIRKPYLRTGMIQGLIAGVMADILLFFMLLLLFSRMAPVREFLPFILHIDFFALLAGIVLFGSLLGYAGSHLAVNRFLNRSLESLI